jgi:hypothetical protein
MTLIRLGTVALLVTLLLSISSCNRFNGPKPTQVVDLPSMIGKSREEITKMVGTPPYKDDRMAVEWELPEGNLSVFKKENGETEFINYRVKKSYSGFATPEEMAALVNIDAKRRKRSESVRGVYTYDDISANGKTFDLAIDRGRSYANARISNARIGGEVRDGFKPTQVVDLPAMIGKPRTEIAKMVGLPPYRDENMAADWQLPEGRLTVFANENKPSIYYNLTSYSDFDPDRGVSSPEEMAALVNINIQGRQPEKIRDGVVAYRNLNVNGKTLDLYIRLSDKRYMGAWIENFK